MIPNLAKELVSTFFREYYCICESSLTERDEDAADAGDPAGDHGEEQDPAPAPLVHGVPAHEVGGNLNSN